MKKQSNKHSTIDEDDQQHSLLDNDSTYSATIDELGLMFHPDNIKNYTLDGTPVSISLHHYWQVLGGPQGLAKSLNTNLRNGIEGTAGDIESRSNKFGKNIKRIPKIKSIWEIVLDAVSDKILVILLIAATISTILGSIEDHTHGWIDGASIYFAVIAITAITTTNNYVKEKQFQRLVAKAAIDFVAVYRGGNGATKTIPVTELQVGDVFKIEQGMRIPADAVLISGVDISCDESAMTGEPDHLEKVAVTDANYESNPDPFLLGKTLIVNGMGIAMVCAVGVNTRSGMAEEKLNTEEDETPLQQKLGAIANQLGKLGIYCALIALLAGIGNFIIRRLLDSSIGWFGNDLSRSESFDEIIKIIIMAITVIVIAVPEGLPLAVTLSFAFSVMKMKKENNLVRKLQSSETMGGANEICSDKTGTLTKNQMTVRAFYTMDQVFVGRPANFRQLKTADYLSEGVIYNCSARIEKTQKGELEALGNVTEQGLLRFLMELGVSCYDALLHKTNYTLQSIPFNSNRKRACTVIRHPNNQNIVRVYCKGGPEVVLRYVTKMFDQNGDIIEINQEKKDEIMRDVVTEQFAKKAYRTLLVAYREYSIQQYEALLDQNNGFQSEQDREALETDMTLVGVYALQDPLRDEIIESVRICHQASVNVRMVTGDNLETAKAIAIEAGILKTNESDLEYACMEGKAFREACGGLRRIDTGNDLIREEIVNKEIFKLIAKRLKVLARSTPEDKYMLVTGLRDIGSVVAVTGDGTNDAPALKKADVGFSMGISGTEVAKEAADIILLDDNFASIVTAMKWGRNIFSNVRKFLQFQLVINIVAIVIMIIGSIALPSHSPPLNTVQMLWINLLMDTFAALALATEDPNPKLLLQKPYSRNESIITPVMWRNIIGQSVYQLLVCLIILFAGKAILGLTYQTDEHLYVDGKPTQKAYHYTILFHAFVMMQAFNEINCRKIQPDELNVFKGFFNNFYFQLIIIITVVVQILLVQFGGAVVKVQPLSVVEHIVCIAIGAFSLVVGLLLKLVVPLSWFGSLTIKQDPLSDVEEKNSAQSVLRKSYRQSVRQSQQRTEQFNRRSTQRELSRRQTQNLSIKSVNHRNQPNEMSLRIKMDKEDQSQSIRLLNNRRQVSINNN